MPPPRMGARDRRARVTTVWLACDFGRSCRARRAFRNLTYFNEADRGGHFAMWEHPELFATELRAAFKSLR